jgi:hypothetical protein
MSLTIVYCLVDVERIECCCSLGYKQIKKGPGAYLLAQQQYGQNPRRKEGKRKQEEEEL